MTLNGTVFEELQQTLVEAYNPNELEQLVRFKLDESLTTIAGSRNQNEVVFSLISWAEQEGRVDELINAAYRNKPNNAKLKYFVEKHNGIILPTDTDTDSLDATNNNVPITQNSSGSGDSLLVQL